MEAPRGSDLYVLPTDELHMSHGAWAMCAPISFRCTAAADQRDPSSFARAQVMQTTKWVKRQLSFLRPEKDHFSKLLRSHKSAEYARIAYKLIELLLGSAEGTEYLATRLVAQLAEAMSADELGVEEPTVNGSGPRG